MEKMKHCACGSLAALLLLAGCASDLGAPLGPALPEGDPAVASACGHRTSVQMYLDAVRRAVYDAWKLPRVPADEHVTLSFRIGDAGEFADLRVVDYSKREFARSAVAALRAAQPLPQPPDSAKCILDLAVTATFTNPLGPQ